jgi:hypothetical protein
LFHGFYFSFACVIFEADGAANFALRFPQVDLGTWTAVWDARRNLHSEGKFCIPAFGRPVQRLEARCQMTKNLSAMGIYPDRTAVSDASNVLHKAGYRATDIPVLSSDN